MRWKKRINPSIGTHFPFPLVIHTQNDTTYIVSHNLFLFFIVIFLLLITAAAEVLPEEPLLLRKRKKKRRRNLLPKPLSEVEVSSEMMRVMVIIKQNKNHKRTQNHIGKQMNKLQPNSPLIHSIQSISLATCELGDPFGFGTPRQLSLTGENFAWWMRMQSIAIG